MNPNTFQTQYQQGIAPTNQALTQYQTYAKNFTDPMQLYQQNLKQFGVNNQYQALAAAQNAVKTTSNLIGALPEQVAQTQAGTEMTAAQRANLMTTRLLPLQQQYGAATQGLSAAQNLYGALLGQAGQATQFGVTGEQQRLAALQNNYQNLLGRQQSYIQGYGTAGSAQAALAQAAAIRQQVQMQANFLKTIQPYLLQYLQNQGGTTKKKQDLANLVNQYDQNIQRYQQQQQQYNQPFTSGLSSMGINMPTTGLPGYLGWLGNTDMNFLGGIGDWLTGK